MIAKKTALAFFTGLLLTGGTWAADGNDGANGTLGADSTGSLDITLSIGDENGGKGSILIQKLDNLDLGEFDASNPNALGDGSNFCVFLTGNPDGFTYDIKPTSSMGDENSKFQIKSPTTKDKIEYTVHYSGNLGATTANEELRYGIDNPVNAAKSVGLVKGSDGNLSCKGENVSIYVQASVEDASKAESATDYGDTLTLLVSPSDIIVGPVPTP